MGLSRFPRPDAIGTCERPERCARQATASAASLGWPLLEPQAIRKLKLYRGISPGEAAIASITRNPGTVHLGKNATQNGMTVTGGVRAAGSEVQDCQSRAGARNMARGLANSFAVFECK